MMVLRFRHFRPSSSSGENDYAAMWDVHTRSNVGYGLDEMVMAFEKFRHVNGASPNHDPDKDVIIAEVAGRMVAYMRTSTRREIDGTYVNFTRCSRCLNGVDRG